MNTERKGTAVVAKSCRYQNKSGGTRWLSEGTPVDISETDATGSLYAIVFTVGRWPTKTVVEKRFLRDITLFVAATPAEAKPSPAPERGDRHNKGKLQWGLMDYPSMEGMIRVLEKGAVMYAPYNWQKGMPFSELLESMQRHLAALMAGEDVDKETGEFHEDHIHCNAMFLSWTRKNRKDMDDRNKYPTYPTPQVFGKRPE